ncbi:MAG TPA: hypothetical protein VMP42_00260 [Actinomycetota bacterium]|nr:hypothetical protein [Actinomycetota bacterium]
MSRLTSEQIESILEGRAVDGPAGERLSDFVRDLREGLVVDPDPETASRHLTAMAAADLSTVRKLRPRRVTTKLALAAVLLLGAGVAAAATARLGGPSSIVPEDFPIPVQVDVETGESESEPAPTSDDPAGSSSGPDDGARAPSSDDGCEVAAATGAAVAAADDPCAQGDGKGGGKAKERRKDRGDSPEELPDQVPSEPGAGNRPGAGAGGGPEQEVPVEGDDASGGPDQRGDSPGDGPAP